MPVDELGYRQEHVCMPMYVSWPMIWRFVKARFTGRWAYLHLSLRLKGDVFLAHASVTIDPPKRDS